MAAKGTYELTTELVERVNAALSPCGDHADLAIRKLRELTDLIDMECNDASALFRYLGWHSDEFFERLIEGQDEEFLEEFSPKDRVEFFKETAAQIYEAGTWQTPVEFLVEAAGEYVYEQVNAGILEDALVDSTNKAIQWLGDVTPTPAILRKILTTPPMEFKPVGMTKHGEYYTAVFQWSPSMREDFFFMFVEPSINKAIHAFLTKSKGNGVEVTNKIRKFFESNQQAILLKKGKELYLAAVERIISENAKAIEKAKKELERKAKEEERRKKEEAKQSALQVKYAAEVARIKEEMDRLKKAGLRLEF